MIIAFTFLAKIAINKSNGPVRRTHPWIAFLRHSIITEFYWFSIFRPVNICVRLFMR